MSFGLASEVLDDRQERLQLPLLPRLASAVTRRYAPAGVSAFAASALDNRELELLAVPDTQDDLYVACNGWQSPSRLGIREEKLVELV